MSSMSDESSVLAKDGHEGDNQDMQDMDATGAAPEANDNGFSMNGRMEESPVAAVTSKVLEYLQEAREESGGVKSANGSVFHGYKNTGGEEEVESRGSSHGSHDSHLPLATNGRNSPAASFSTPDDTPSIHVSSYVAGGLKLIANSKDPLGLCSFFACQ